MTVEYGCVYTVVSPVHQITVNMQEYNCSLDYVVDFLSCTVMCGMNK